MLQPGNRLSDSASIASYSSSKRSRSIYAPYRANSVADQTSDPAHSQDGEVEADESVLSSGVSQASRSLHAVLMDQPEQSRPALFPDNLNTYRSNPQALVDLSSKQLATFVHREGGYENVIRTLARDLAEKDAEVAMLRKKNDKFAYLFKDHLTSVHQMSRLDADKRVQSHFPDTSENSTTYSDDVQESLAEALEDANPFGDHNTVAESYGTAALVDSHQSIRPAPDRKSTAQDKPKIPARGQSSIARRQTGPVQG